VTKGAAAAGLAIALAAAAAPLPGRADDVQYVTVGDRLICRTQQALRNGIRALESRDRNAIRALDDCHFSVPGIPATLIQDNINQIKIRLRAEGEQADVWTTPETIRPVKKRVEE
jgi:hypothetical protein